MDDYIILSVFILSSSFTWKREINPFRYEIYNENLFCPAGKPIFVVSKTWN